MRSRLLALGIVSIAAAATSGAGAEPWPQVDGAAVAAHNDVVYLAPAREGWMGLPLGNGTLGAQVWQPDGLMFQFNTPLSGVYGGAIARLCLATAPSPLEGLQAYRQHLSLSKAILTTQLATTRGALRTQTFIPADTDALVLEVSDQRSDPIERVVELVVWRPTATRVAEGDTLVVADVLKVAHQPDYRYALAVTVEGAPCRAEKAEGDTVRLRVAGGQFVVYAALAAGRDEKFFPIASARERLQQLKSRGLAAIKQSHEAWWRQFWSRSFVQLASDDGVADYLANLWYVHLYAMAAGSRGEVPPKFNGGLWTDAKDSREWGPCYWHWNTQETYWPLYAANHLELLAPYYRMYFDMLPRVRQQTQEYFGVEGAQYAETIAFDGTDATGKGPKEMGVHKRLPVPAKFAHTNMILSSSAEIGMQYWWYYLYTGDVEFLRQKAYPVMRAAAEFLVHYMDKDEQGRYYLYPSNAHESFWKVRNPTTDLAAIRYLFPATIEAARLLSCDADFCAVLRERLEHLSPYPIDAKTSAIGPFALEPNQTVEIRNAENPELSPIGVFPLITLGSPDYELGLKTFRARRNVNVYGWTTDSICAARLGLAEAADGGLAGLLVNHAQRYQDHPSGLMDYYARHPAIHPYLEGSGTFSTAVGEMLLQSWPNAAQQEPVIRVCPALPKAWRARLKLLAMGGFEVTAAAEKGAVLWAAVHSQRGGTARVVNPFPAVALVVDGQTEILKSDARQLRFDTEPGHTYVLTSAAEPQPAIEALPTEPNAAPKKLLATGPWLGLPAPAVSGKESTN